MIRGCIALSLGLLLLAGCRTHPEIPVSDEQSLVMESTILAAGITAEQPTLTTSDIQPRHPRDSITKDKNPSPFIIGFTGMTPEDWKCILWKRHAV